MSLAMSTKASSSKLQMLSRCWCASMNSECALLSLAAGVQIDSGLRPDQLDAVVQSHRGKLVDPHAIVVRPDTQRCGVHDAYPKSWQSRQTLRQGRLCAVVQTPRSLQGGGHLLVTPFLQPPGRRGQLLRSTARPIRFLCQTLGAADLSHGAQGLWHWHWHWGRHSAAVCRLSLAFAQHCIGPILASGSRRTGDQYKMDRCRCE